MKVVFSRKGFDTQYGKVPNAVLPDQTLVSFPIEDVKSIVAAAQVRRGGESIGDLVEQLSGGRIARNYPAHLDPDLDPAAYPRQPGWRPVLGQTGSSLSHLENQGVGVGDLFLFFGWFRPVTRHESRWAYSRGTQAVHALWGWLHVGTCFSHQDLPAGAAKWLAYHPHLQRSARKRHVLFAAADALQVGGRRIPGGGIFPRFTKRRVLSAPGENMSVWRVPGWMHPEAARARFSYIHEPSRWRHADTGDGALVRTIGKGQEIVMDAVEAAPLETWLESIFEDVPSLSR